jgi:hypothetical protein
MRGSLVRIKVLDKDQGSGLINAMMIKTNLVEVWERQGLVHNVDCWLQMTDKILHRERSRQEEEDQGIPHMHFKAGVVM